MSLKTSPFVLHRGKNIPLDDWYVLFLSKSVNQMKWTVHRIRP